VSVNSAPIGAQVFAIERRNHSKTGVYEDLCTRVPVDTTIATDKLKKAEKGFKFARFDVSFQPIGSLLYRQGSKDRLERGSARMGGLPFESAPPNWRWPSRRCNLMIASGSAFSGLDRPSSGALQSRSQCAQPSEFPTLLRRLPAGPKCPSAAVIWTTQRYSRRTDSNLPGSESRDSDVLYSGRRRTRSLGRAPNHPNQGRHSACSMGWVRVGMTARLRKNLRGETTRRRRNERT
jgi:hypothetical protein